MRTEYLVSWSPPDELLAILHLQDERIHPWAHQYEDEKLAKEHVDRALVTLMLIFRGAGLDPDLIKVETTEVRYEP